ncbi:HAD family phosphatase [Thalassococcus sp. CAU 1522]|uniref:HAD family phosphatase n=1 Tax=Thalassococcus arenae TaxID=2851652 RepID=A0ABS6NAJ5_9RHOB|nr:HAD family phosphatase [Thalassococcus arenae]MBV2361032.1 HAD family phosphatase [Thalassococcus arenae]
MPDAALLFDLDGTLLNSDPIHIAVFREMMEPRGITIDEAFYARHVHGRLNVDFFAEFLPDEPDPQALSEAKEAAFRDRLPRPYPAMPGAAALVNRARDRGWGLAVVTNAMRPNAEAMLSAIGLDDAFETIVIGEECARGKPDPLPYRTAMDALGVAPNRCVAFEDSPAGLRAARRSGAYTVGIRSSLPDARLHEAGAHISITDFTDTALESILDRLTGVPAP